MIKARRADIGNIMKMCYYTGVKVIDKQRTKEQRLNVPPRWEPSMTTELTSASNEQKKSSKKIQPKIRTTKTARIDMMSGLLHL